MSRDLSIALTAASLPILALITARWEETREAIGHSAWNVARLGVVVAALIVSIVGGAFVAADQGDPPELFIFVQLLAVGGGAVNAAFPLMVDLLADLQRRMPPKAYQLLTRALSVLLVAGFVVLVVVSIPWWHALILFAAVALTVLVFVPFWLKFWDSVVRPYFDAEPEPPESDCDDPTPR